MMFTTTLSLRKLGGATTLASIVACVAAGASQAGPGPSSPDVLTRTVAAGSEAYSRASARPGPGYPDVIERALRSRLRQAKKLKGTRAQAKAAKPSRQFDDWFRDPPTPICSTGSTVDDWFRDRACGRG
jgi:hypothetical protein